MEARESRHRCLIDDGEARLQWQVAQEELEHAPGVASCASPHDGLPPDHEFENTALLARLIRLTRRLHSRTHKELVRATVKVAMDEEHAREQGSVFGQTRAREAERLEKGFCLTAYLHTAYTRSLHQVVGGLVRRDAKLNSKSK